MSLQRPTASALLKHPFIRRAKKNSVLIEFIERAAEYRARAEVSSDSDVDSDTENDKNMSSWSYPTVKSGVNEKWNPNEWYALLFYFVPFDRDDEKTVRMREKSRPAVSNMNESPTGTIAARVSFSIIRL